MQSFGHKESSILEKKIFKVYIIYMGMAAILVNGPKLF